jgi:hypothetical protein
MSVSYDEAPEIVRMDTEPGWGFGTYCLDDREILENDEVYVFNVGAREFIVSEDTSFSLEISAREGRVQHFTSASGHYEPGPAEMRQLVDEMARHGVRDIPVYEFDGKTPMFPK